MSLRLTELNTARELAESGEVDDAYIIADKWLKEDPNDIHFLTIMIYVMLKAEKFTIAYQLAKRVTELNPTEPGAWMNLGMSCADLWLNREAVRAYTRGLQYATRNEHKVMLNINLTSAYINAGKFAQAEKFARAAIELDPENHKAIANLGFSQLAQRQWKEGWINYRKSWGSDWRPKVKYGDEPDWTGEPGKVVLSGEQGIGDVLSFASMIPDAAKKADIVFEVNKKLKNLLVRSFSDVKVYGTRETKEFDKEQLWDEEDRKIDYSLSIGQCAELFRNSDESFPGTPYLIADPDRVLMWRTLFQSKAKPVIGIAWSGGIMKTGSKGRQVTLDQLLPLFQSVNAHWVSLQYKPAAKEIATFKKAHPEIDLVEYPHATLTNDYDDTAGLVAALDRVVCMQTAITHLAGGLGIPCWTFIPDQSQWRYGEDYEDFLWAQSVRLIRQKGRTWDEVITDVAGQLNAHYSRIPEATARPSRKRKLRRDRSKVRANGQSDHRQAGNQPSA